ncbi:MULTISPECIES: AraC family transcriptional regulator [unclassified Microbacterium]|uniref:helix-turn-helix transcriptional regulator n=1 Tax=unclassified Microbacterium TaxID=2609290 RepID=UPI0012F9CCD2|nr:AraC family transcriptional regulator [Microbacterium sp. MAH-37]
MAIGFRGLLSTQLGAAAAGQGMLRGVALRGVLLTAHQVMPGPWEWNGAPDAPLPYSALVLPTDGLPVPATGSDAVFLPATANARIEWAKRRDVLVVWLPAFALGEAEQLTGGRVVPVAESRLAAATRAFATSALRSRQGESPVGDYSMEQLLSEMALGLLLESQEQSLLGERSRSLVDRARALMLSRREDPELTTAVIAAELHVSPRQLQREFARKDSSPSAELRLMRATLAEAVLRDPAHAMLTVAEVARFCGFHSALHLRRALAACGLPTPRELRAQATALPPGELVGR